jgi:aspartate-semialdehyde dehydrogenase
MKLCIGIIGATGVVGRTLLSLLETFSPHSSFSLGKIKLYSSPKSVGEELQFRDRTISVEALSEESLFECQVVFLCAGSSVSKAWVPKLIEKQILCIDKASIFRMKQGIPLVVPEVNKEDMKGSFLLTSPNCCTIPLVVALKPLDDLFGLEEVFVSTYQSVSGAGKTGIETLEYEIRHDHQADHSPFPKPIGYNVLPYVGGINPDSGHTDEEEKIVEETKKILNLPNLMVHAHSVRVPTFIGHSEAVSVRTRKPLDLKALEEAYLTYERVVLPPTRHNHLMSQEFFTPKDIEGTDKIYLSRFRMSSSSHRHLSFWVSCDNLRKGAALNALDILEAYYD